MKFSGIKDRLDLRSFLDHCFTLLRPVGGDKIDPSCRGCKYYAGSAFQLSRSQLLLVQPAGTSDDFLDCKVVQHL
jgi:hypothetical protein